MTITDALAIVIELAEHLLKDDSEPELKEECKRQRHALKKVQKLYKALD